MNNKEAIKQLERSMELRGFAKSTQKAYTGAVVQLSKFHTIPLNEMNYDHVRDFLLHAIKVRKLSSEFINTSYSGIKFLFEVALEREWNMKNIPRLKKKRKFPEILSVEEIMSILNSLSNLKHKAVMAVIYSAGLRVSEASNLLINDIDSKNMRIFIRQGKGNKDRYAQLSNYALELLREYYKEFRPQKWLFQSEFCRNKTSLPIHTRTIQNTFKEAKYRAGITKNVTPHSMRHSYATHLVENGTNLIKVKELLGHDKLETTMLYVHLASKDILNTKSPLDIAWEKQKEVLVLKNPIFNNMNLGDKQK